jgi:predicted transcriptional regulator
MSDTTPATNPTTIRLDDEDRRLLEKLAKRERMPRSQIVRLALRRYGVERGLIKEPQRASA